MEKEIVRNDHKWVIKENERGLYDITFYEYYISCGWRKLSKDINYTKEVIEIIIGEL